MPTSLGGYTIPKSHKYGDTMFAISACRGNGLLHGDILSFPDMRYFLSWSTVSCWSPIGIFDITGTCFHGVGLYRMDST